MNINELGKRIVLEGTINTRSLEGYESSDGRRIKAKRIYRSDALWNITENDISFFENEIHLKKDIDLRGANEIECKPDKKIPGCKLIHCPIEEDLNKALPNVYPHPEYNVKRPDVYGTIEYIYRLDPHGDATYSFETIYRNFIKSEYSQKHYEMLLKEILSNKEGSVLFHCADGKDRCGTGVALFLAMVGIDKETIIKDYLKTNENTKAKADERERYLREECGVTDEVIINSVRIVAGVRENFLRAAFDEIENTFGGFDNYFHNQLHFTDEMIEEMKDNYLE